MGDGESSRVALRFGFGWFEFPGNCWVLTALSVVSLWALYLALDAGVLAELGCEVQTAGWLRRPRQWHRLRDCPFLLPLGQPLAARLLGGPLTPLSPGVDTEKPASHGPLPQATVPLAWHLLLVNPVSIRVLGSGTGEL